MKRYDTYKDSGIEWFGAIPRHWTLSKAKHMFHLVNDNVTDPTLPKVALENIESGTGRYIKTESDFMGEGVEFIPNDILFGKLRPYLAKVYKADFRGQSVGDIYVFRGKESQDADYLKFLMLSHPFISVVDGSTYGAKMPRANWDFISQMILPNPPLSEQHIIASYLDDKVGQIDAVIAEKEKMVEDLQNYRKSVISEAVTRGLNPDVPMKDSGIDWIGMIPEHWIVSKLKAFADVQTGSTPSTSVDKYWENPIEDWYTPSDFEDSDIQLKPSSRKLATIAFKEEACRVFDANTVLIVGIGATLGKVGISSKSCSANQQINALTFKEKVLPLFGAYYLYSIKDTMKAVANAATLAIMNQSTTKDLPFICPPYEEQRSIVKAIDNKISVTANGVSELQAQIEDLKSYKSSLITEAVTGKIDLR